MIKAVLDTNTIISALNFAGKPGKVLDLAVQGSILNVISQPILVEVRNVLTSKFLWEAREAEDAIDWLTLFSDVVYPTERLKVIDYEPDNRILECAEEGDADFIISGDRKHLLKLGQYKTIKIVDAAMFLEMYAKNSLTT